MEILQDRSIANSSLSCNMIYDVLGFQIHRAMQTTFLTLCPLHVHF